MSGDQRNAGYHAEDRAQRGPRGIAVVIVEPGVVNSNIFENSAPLSYFDKQSPYLDLMRRNGKLYKALLQKPSQPEDVALAILEAVRSEAPPLRVVVGEDARQLIEGRRRISDEDWIALGGRLSDEEFARRFKAYFGIELL